MDATIPVPLWPLSDIGKERHRQFHSHPVLSKVTSVYSSEERKAQDAAKLLSDYKKLHYQTVYDLHENDRSATGFLEPEEFERVASEFFRYPKQSIRGWERAIDAQKRTVECVQNILDKDDTSGDIALLGHGGVGTLLMCHLAKVNISRTYDQPGAGGGNYFAFDFEGHLIINQWTSIDEKANFGD